MEALDASGYLEPFPEKGYCHLRASVANFLFFASPFGSSRLRVGCFLGPCPFFPMLNWPHVDLFHCPVPFSGFREPFAPLGVLSNRKGPARPFRRPFRRRGGPGPGSGPPIGAGGPFRGPGF